MNDVQKEFEEWTMTYGFDDEEHMLNTWIASRKNITVELPEHCKGNTLTVQELKVMLDKVGITLKGE